MLRALYVIAIGLLFAGVVGFGFSAFYPAPEYPQSPIGLYSTPSDKLTDAEVEEQKKFEIDQRAYNEVSEDYNRNLSVGLIVAAMVILAVSILGLGKVEMIGDGATLGGVFTLLYGLGRAMAAGDAKIRFFSVLIGLVVLLFLTYWKFLKEKKNSPAL